MDIVLTIHWDLRFQIISDFFEDMNMYFNSIIFYFYYFLVIYFSSSLYGFMYFIYCIYIKKILFDSSCGDN